jgi:phage terminase small subunit
MNQLTKAPPHVLAAYKRLSPLRQAFALALPTAESQEAAMLTAGYGAQTARKTASATASHPDVVIVVDYLVGNAIEAASDSVERLIRELCHVGLADPLGMFNDDDTLKPLREWPEALRRTLSGIEIDEIWEYEGTGPERKRVQAGLTKKVKFWDKLRAIEHVAKIRGYMLPEKHEHVHRIEGMAGLLAEIDGSGTGPGSSSSR